jgi:hypothetical protein
MWVRVQVADAQTQTRKRNVLYVAIGDGDGTEAERKCWNAQQLWVWVWVLVLVLVLVLVWVDHRLAASSSAVPCGGCGGGQGTSEVVTCRRTPCPHLAPGVYSTAQHSTTLSPARKRAGPIACLMGRESERSKTHVTIRESGVNREDPGGERCR